MTIGRQFYPLSPVYKAAHTAVLLDKPVSQAVLCDEVRRVISDAGQRPIPPGDARRATYYKSSDF